MGVALLPLRRANRTPAGKEYPNTRRKRCLPSRGNAIHRVILRNHVLSAAEGVIIVPSNVPNSGQGNVVVGMNWAIKVLGPISYRVDGEARGVPKIDEGSGASAAPM
jgi:hypothetical protein